ncbi:MAG: hypothetical protein HXS44_03945 [Theionarchaea archaeon]|nr:hypothetical protein [Theionarchaea archaeon]
MQEKCPFCYVAQSMNRFPLKYLIVIILVSLATTVGLMLFMSSLNKALVSPEPHYDIIDFEFAFTEERAGIILNTWGPELEREALKSLYIDFAYLVSYALFLSSLALLVARSRHAHLQRVGVIIARMPWVAAALDAVENICLIHVITASTVPAASVFCAGACALIKFGLVGVAIVFIVVGGGYVLTKSVNYSRMSV